MDIEVRVGPAVDEENEIKRRKAWGRGFREAAETAGLDVGALMHENKLRRAEEALTGISAKVYDAVPFDDTWTKHQIVGEMSKRTGTHIDPHVCDGCLVDLKERGLIQEVGVGTWKRVAAKPRVFVRPNGAHAPTVQQKPDVAVEVGPPAPPLDVLANLSKKLRALADEFDAAAIQLAGDMQQHALDSEKLKQLQALLR